MNFDAAGPPLIIYSVFVKYLIKKGNKMNQYFRFVLISGKFMVQLSGRSCTVFSLRLVSP